MSPSSLRSHKLPRVFLSLLLPSLGFAAIGSAQAATFYVRTDGGDAAQCTGRADAPYSGSGTAQACAWKNPNIALPNSGSARIMGGDTLLIGAGSFQIGSGGYMQKVPSGPNATTRTRIIGKAGTKLVGVAGTHRVLNLDGSSNVEIGNLEITDNSDCVYNHSNAAAACTSAMAWARVGVYATASNNVWMHDVNVHGMAARGFNAGGLSNWTLERVKMNKNGSAGWDGNVGTGSNSGQMILRDIEIGWNGCGERVATGEPWACWAQTTGGYGDGFGTVDTGGQWLIEDAFIHHNTSDGLDLRYMDGADATNVTLRRIYSVANAGNQVKIKGNSLIENSVLVGNCTYFRGRDFMAQNDLCRAYGSTLLLILTGNDTATVRHNTIAGEGDAQIAYGEGASTDKVNIQNNLVVGFPYYANAATATLFSGGSAPAAKSFSGNMAWKVRTCQTGTTCTQDPKLTNMTLAAFDAEPLAGSPVTDKAPTISGMSTDFVLQPRPSGAANDVGAYEVQAGSTTPPQPPTPTPTCTRAAPTVTLTGPTAAVAAGTENKYTLSLKNNDSSACANTSFAIARSVPSGWTGELSTTAIALSPGASGTATLAVMSNSAAAVGSYGIGVGTSSANGATHTGNASATYSVAAAAVGLTETVSTSKASYKAGEVVSITARVLKNGVAVKGASVAFDALKPNGVNHVILSATTDASGYAKVSFTSGVGSSSIGTYKLSAVATSGSLTKTATTTFSVNK